MSYCRFSSMDFGCDIYAYQDCYGGYTIHVAGNRVVGDVPKVDWNGNVEELAQQYQSQMKYLEDCKREKIDLPYAGESFHVDTAEEFIDTLETLQELGYRMPESLIDDIREEIDTEENQS